MKIPKIKSPEKIQDFINALSFNFEEKGDTVMSPRRVLESGKAQCMEGALLAAAILWQNGERPLLLDLTASKNDWDHVVALFKRNGRWGAISKTNHAVLRYREPVYKTVRELALSYFHEYFLPDGTKTLISFSKPFNLSKFGKEWVTSEEDLFNIVEALEKAEHQNIISPKFKFRKADPIEREAGELTEWKKKGKKVVL